VVGKFALQSTSLENREAQLCSCTFKH